ncbi:MAG: Rne/Rng family ribonuclease [Chitinivibrionales bacterium]
MDKKILFSAAPTEKRAALLEKGKLVELVVERPDQFRLLGNIYRGVVTSILPGIQSAFIDVGLDKSAFLHASDVDPTLLLNEDDELIERFTGRDVRSQRRKVPRVPIEKVLEVGQQILVQVIKEPIGSKSPKVTTQISIAGRFLVLVPDADFIGVSKKTSDVKKRRHLKKLIDQLKPKGVGFIVRTIGLKVSENEFVAEIHQLVDAWRRAQKEALSGGGPKLVYKEYGITTTVIRDIFSEDVTEVYVDHEDDFSEIKSYLTTVSPNLLNRVKLYKEKMPLFDRFNIEKDLERSLRRKVWLKSGGYLLLDHAEALIAIDVNTGRNVGKSNLEETITRTNLEAANEICRQLRLRDIGGLIVIDFIDMRNPENRKKLENEMFRLLEADPTATSATGLSKFGLMEVTRKRVRPELQELFTDVCHACNGLGWVFSPQTVTARIDRALKREAFGQKRIAIAVHPSVAAYMRKDSALIVRTLGERHGYSLEVHEDEEQDQDEYELHPLQEGQRFKTSTEKEKEEEESIA